MKAIVVQPGLLHDTYAVLIVREGNTTRTFGTFADVAKADDYSRRMYGIPAVVVGITEESAS